MVEQGQDIASAGDHADSDHDKAHTHDDDESRHRVEPTPLTENTGRMHEKSKAVALDTPQLPARKHILASAITSIKPRCD